MLNKISPLGIISAHFDAMRDNSTGKIILSEVIFHITFPAFIAILHIYFFDEITENVASIVVSAASIVAGLMLNLMVLIYTLAYNAKSAAVRISNFSEFQKISTETLTTISYTVFLCILLVIFSFLGIANVKFNSLVICSRFMMVYLGVASILCLLLVLKRCYSIVLFELKH